MHTTAPNRCWPACAELRGGERTLPTPGRWFLGQLSSRCSRPPQQAEHWHLPARCGCFHVHKHHILKITGKVVCLPPAWPWILQCHQSAVCSPKASGALFLSQHTAEFPTGQLSRSPLGPASSPASPHISSPPYLNQAPAFLLLRLQNLLGQTPMPALEQPQGVSELQEDFYLKSHFSR